jgi:hypothetical protein
MDRLEQSLSLGQGLIIDSTAVVSRKAHLEPREQPGLVHVLMEKDAGITYLNLTEKDKFVHIDVFHQPAEINIIHLADRIRNGIGRVLPIIMPDPRLPPEERKQAGLELTRHIHLVTGAGEGTVLEPLLQVYPPPARRNSHVHILAKITPEFHALVFCIIEETKKALACQDVKPRPVRQLIHLHNKKITSPETRKS